MALTSAIVVLVLLAFKLSNANVFQEFTSENPFVKRGLISYGVSLSVAQPANNRLIQLMRIIKRWQLENKFRLRNTRKNDVQGLLWN